MIQWKYLITFFSVVVSILLMIIVIKTNFKPEDPALYNAKRLRQTSLVVRIDKCEYLVLTSPNGAWVVTHKGNCDNPQHKR